MTTNLISIVRVQNIDHYASNVTFSTDTHQIQLLSNIIMYQNCSTVARTGMNTFLSLSFEKWQFILAELSCKVPLSIQSVSLSINSGHIKYVFISLPFNHQQFFYTTSTPFRSCNPCSVLLLFLAEADMCFGHWKIFLSFFFVFKFKRSFFFISFNLAIVIALSLYYFLFLFFVLYASHRLIICSGVELCEWWIGMVICL